MMTILTIIIFGLLIVILGGIDEKPVEPGVTYRPLVESDFEARSYE